MFFSRFFSKWPLLIYCNITKKARIINHTSFPTFLGSRNPMKVLFLISEFNFTILVLIQPKNSFLQLSQKGINLDEKRQVIINRQKILYQKGLMQFFPKISGFTYKSSLYENQTRNICIISYKDLDINFTEQQSCQKLWPQLLSTSFVNCQLYPSVRLILKTL